MRKMLGEVTNDVWKLTRRTADAHRNLAILLEKRGDPYGAETSERLPAVHHLKCRSSERNHLRCGLLPVPGTRERVFRQSAFASFVRRNKNPFHFTIERVFALATRRMSRRGT